MKKFFYGFLIFMYFIGLNNVSPVEAQTNSEPLVIKYTDLETSGRYKPSTKIITTNTKLETKRDLHIILLYLKNENGEHSREFRLESDQFPFLEYRIETGKLFTVHLEVTNSNPKIRSSRGVYEGNYFRITNIEGLLSIEVGEAKSKAEEEARVTALWAPRNPNNLDRSQYREMNVSDFSFEMVAGKLPVGSKVRFQALFLTKPTGTSYKFREIDLGINLTSKHNFIRHLTRRMDFESYFDNSFGNVTKVNQSPVIVYVTVLKTGQFGECSIDILNWTIPNPSTDPLTVFRNPYIFP